MYVEKGFEGFSYDYDFKSWYPSRMIKNNSQYPIKAGKFTKLTQMEFLKYGIYRAKCIFDNKFMRQQQ